MDSGRIGAACAWQDQDGEWTGRRFHLGDNKEVFDVEVYAIYQALKIFKEHRQSGKQYTIFSDCQPAMQRVRTDRLGPGQQWARASIEVASRIAAAGSSVEVIWVPAQRGVAGNEAADGLAEEAAEGWQHSVQDEVR